MPESARPHAAPERPGRPVSTRPPPRILWIDDEARPDDALFVLLALDGFEVDCATTGAAGLLLARAGPHDVIAVDVRLGDCHGLTVVERLRAAGLAVNTDIGLVVGSGSGCTIEGNFIQNSNKHAFAGFHVGYFNNGNQSNSVYSDNFIQSQYEDKLSFGMVVGGHPWDPDLTVGGAVTVVDNYIEGAVINLAVDGISAGYIARNETVGAQGTYGFNECANWYAGEEFTAEHFGDATVLPSTYTAIYYHGSCYGE